ASVHMADMLVQQAIHRFAVVGRGIERVQQAAYLIMAHVQTAAIPDEPEALQVEGLVLPVVAVATRGRREQARLLVIADRLRAAVCRMRQFTDFHEWLLFRFPSAY